jgi:hypothetical protein
MLEVKYTFICNYCGKAYIQQHSVPLNAEVPKPITPRGWNVFNNGYICNEESVIINALIKQEERKRK